MATYGNQDYTNFRAVNLRGSTQIRLQGDAAGTLSFDSTEGVERAWKFPNKSGTFPIMGTFAVQLPSASEADFSTIVTVSGIRTEDGVVVQLNGANDAARTYGFAQSTGYILVQSVPGNGNITLYFNNPGNATAYVDLRGSYLAVR